MNIIDAIRHHSRVRPFDIAVIHSSGAANYLQLATSVAGLAARMRSEGIEPDTTAAIYVSDAYLHLALILAAMLNGTRTVSAQPNFEPIPAAVPVDHWLCDRALGFSPQGNVVPVNAAWIPETGPDARPSLLGAGFPDPQAVCRMYTSSGTTGTPKVIGHSTHTLEMMATRQLSLEPISQGPNLCMMWLSTIGGFGTAQTTLWHGATLALAVNPQKVLRWINLHKVVNLRASPQQLQGLVAMVSGRPVRFPSLQRIEVGGSSIPSAVMMGARATLCSNLVGIYGSTEASLVAQAPGSVLYKHPDAAGFVVPGAEVRIVDDADQPVAYGVEGHVQIRTPYMISGYMGDPVNSAKAFRGGWFVPGDMGILRADNLLRITGRSDEMINAGGVKLSPAAVDEFLLKVPGVRDAATFAYRRPGQNDAVWAAVVAGENFNEQAVLATARAHLNSRAPVKLVLMDEIPRNSMGKALRQQLSQQASDV
ncbi:MAG: fatty acid--CoA ligase family protein [Pseudomonadota bacterium]